MKILFIGKRFYTNKDALVERFGRIRWLPWAWARSGEQVELLLVDYHSREHHCVTDGSLRIVSTPLLGHRLPGNLAHQVFRFRPDAVVASGDCYLGTLGWLLAGLSGATFIFDIYDRYDQFGAYRRPLGLDLFGTLRRRAALRLYASVALANQCGERKASGWVRVPNGVDPELFRPLDTAVCRARLQLDPGARLVGYFGSMDPDRGVRDLVDALRLLRARGLDVRLLICGKPDARTPLTEEWIIDRGLVPQAEVPLYINSSDVLVLPYRSSALLDMAASCKIAEFLLCQRPLVATRTPNFMENFPGQAAQLAAALCAPAAVADLARAIEIQLHERRVPAPPTGMGWEQIAADALTAIRSVSLPGAHGP